MKKQNITRPPERSPSILSLWYLQILFGCNCSSFPTAGIVLLPFLDPLCCGWPWGLLALFGNDKRHVRNIVCVSLGSVPSAGTPKHGVPFHSAFPDPARCFLKRLCPSALPALTTPLPPPWTEVQWLPAFLPSCYYLSAFLIWGCNDITLCIYLHLFALLMTHVWKTCLVYLDILCNHLFKSLLIALGLAAVFLLLYRSSLHILDRSLVCEL